MYFLQNFYMKCIDLIHSKKLKSRRICKIYQSKILGVFGVALDLLMIKNYLLDFVIKISIKSLRTDNAYKPHSPNH